MEAESDPGRARYDAIVDWYLPWVGTSAGLICDPAMAVMPTRLDGQRWLDVACGAGRTTRELARRGAGVVGVDLSSNLIARALAAEAVECQGITYVVADVADPARWWDGERFDGAVCEMAFMDIDDVVGTVQAVAETLRPRGAFLVSLVHPCFPGNEAGLSSWPPERGYAAEGFWTFSPPQPKRCANPGRLQPPNLGDLPECLPRRRLRIGAGPRTSHPGPHVAGAGSSAEELSGQQPRDPADRWGYAEMVRQV